MIMVKEIFGLPVVQDNLESVALEELQSALFDMVLNYRQGIFGYIFHLRVDNSEYFAFGTLEESVIFDDNGWIEVFCSDELSEYGIR
jgi:hypothetical protein